MTMIAEAALSISPFERSRWRLRRTRHPYGFSYGFSIATIWRETSCTLLLRGFAALVGLSSHQSYTRADTWGKLLRSCTEPEKRPSVASAAPAALFKRGYRRSGF